MPTEQQNFREPDLFGHVYDGQKADDGYAVCSACDCRENTEVAAQPCKGTMVGRGFIRLQNALSQLYMLVRFETDLPDCAANGVESQGLDEGVVRASEIMEHTREIINHKRLSEYELKQAAQKAGEVLTYRHGRPVVTSGMMKKLDCPFEKWNDEPTAPKTPVEMRREN